MKKKFNKKPTLNDMCAICGKPFAMTHEVFYGNPYARFSQDYNMTIKLCYDHHQHHKTGIHFDRAFDLKIKRKYQTVFEKEHGHEKFIEIFDKDYIAMEDWFYLKEY